MKVENPQFNEIQEQVSLAELELKIKSMIGRTEKEFQCTVCGITKPTRSGIKTHVETRHIELRYRCNICETEVSYGTINGLKIHYNQCHNKIVLPELIYTHKLVI